MDTAIIVAIIQAIGAIIIAAGGAIGAVVFGKYRTNKALFETALRDIEFLLALEDHHVREHRERGYGSMRKTVRRHVRNETTLTWSGRFTPSRIARIRERLGLTAANSPSPPPAAD